jgi:hypothetical protein
MEGGHSGEGRRSSPYKAFFGAENNDMGLENTSFWEINNE